MIKLLIVAIIQITLTSAALLYNHNSISFRDQTWMSGLDDGIPLRKLSILGTHSSLSTGTMGDAFQTQASSLTTQLQAGIRALDIRCRHKNDEFRIHERSVNLGSNFDDVLNTVKTFLAAYPEETILMHVVEQYNPSGNSRSFEETYIMYRDMFLDLIWQPTTQNPTLGMTRGKIVIIQNFNGATHGLLYDSFTTLEHKQYATNWDQHDRWIDIKNFMAATNTEGESRISFWTGSVGSFPYFVASGKSSPGNNDPQLLTGSTTIINNYPDFPRVMCVGSLCSIAFQGINILAYNYYTQQGFTYLGILFTDFVGDDLLSESINLNSQAFGSCSQIKKDKGCSFCSTTDICLGCDEISNYMYDSNTQDCKAAIGYYLNGNYEPEPCSTSLPGCLECSSDTVCTKCDTYINYKLENDNCEAADGFYLDSQSIPVPCSILGCFLCSSETLCTQCSQANNFVMDNNGNCICDSANNYYLKNNACICQSGYYMQSDGTCTSIPSCSDSNSGCSVCQGDNCIQCDTSSYFVLSSTQCYCELGRYFDGQDCLPCTNLSPACQQCSSENLCISCNDNFTVNQGNCECSPQYYQFDSDTCLSCPIGCLHCLSDNQCTTCDSSSKFKIVGGLCQCQSGMFVKNYSEQLCVPCNEIIGCLKCDMYGCLQCDALLGFKLDGNGCVCDYGHYVNSLMKTCSQCLIEGCLNCDTQITCLECSTPMHFLQDSQCIETCGDGVLYSLECDDGNLVDGDGCSKTCEIQENYQCIRGSYSTPSYCSFAGNLSLELVQFKKDPSQNKITIRLKIQPNITSLPKINFNECLQANFPIDQNNITFNPDSHEIQWNFTYTQSLNKYDMEVTFDPPNTSQFFFTKSTKLGMPATTDNNLGLKAYPDFVYQQADKLQYAIQALAYISIAIFVFSIIFSSKLMGVEMMLLLQMGYLGLVMVDKLEALLYPFILLWPVNGYNLLIEGPLEGKAPPRVIIPGYKDEFLQNFSLNFIICGIPIFIGVILFIVSQTCLKYSKEDLKKLKKHKRIKRLGFRFLKQWQLTALLFVQFHLNGAFVFAIMYGSEIAGVIGGGILLCILAGFCWLIVKRPLHFGDYKQFFFKRKFIEYNFYMIVIIWRCIFITGITILNEHEACGYYATILATLYLVILAILRPYTHNLRPVINSIVVIIICIIYTIYRSVITEEAQWITTNLPIILLSLLYAAVVFNLIYMILYIKQKCQKKNQKKSYEKQAVILELQLNQMTPRVLKNEQRAIQSPYCTEFQDNPTSYILKNLRKTGQLNSIDKNKSYMREYEAI